MIVPCYNGKSLALHEELVVNGLSAISIKHHKGCCIETPDAVHCINRESYKNDNEKTVKEVKTRTSKMGKESVEMFSTTGLPLCLGERIKVQLDNTVSTVNNLLHEEPCEPNFLNNFLLLCHFLSLTSVFNVNNEELFRGKLYVKVKAVLTQTWLYCYLHF